MIPNWELFNQTKLTNLEWNFTAPKGRPELYSLILMLNGCN